MSPAAILQLHPDTTISRNPETLQSREDEALGSKQPGVTKDSEFWILLERKI
jgi:hypothetical protein